MIILAENNVDDKYKIFLSGDLYLLKVIVEDLKVRHPPLGCGDFKNNYQIIFGIREPASFPDIKVALYFVL